MFNKNSRAKNGHTSYCKECAKLKATLWVIQNPYKRSENQKNHYKKHTEKITKKQKVHRSKPESKQTVKNYSFLYNLRKRGLTPDTYKKKILDQNNKCEICEQKFTTKRKPAIDHCHISRKTRGILCIGCNASLGHIERPGFLEKALIYLDKYKSHL